MEESGLPQPELVGRADELAKLKRSLDNAIAGHGSTVFISGEAGIGKTRLVSELLKEAGSKQVQVIKGWCLAESLEPLMPVKTALRDAGLYHLISSEPPPNVISAYLMNEAGMLIAKAEKVESGLDSDIFTSMLKAVGDFVQDSLSMMGKEGGGGLNSLGYQKFKILIQTSGRISIATVIEGSESEFLIDDMKRTLTEIGDRLDSWIGDVSEVEDLEPRISWFVNSGKYDGRFLVDDPKLKQENLFDSVLLGVQRGSEEGVVIVFVDDLQWADPTTLSLLHYLSRNIGQHKVLILGTYRPEDIAQTVDEKPHSLVTVMQNMNREDLVEKIELDRFGIENTKNLVVSALGPNSFEESFFKRVYKETEGTPFFVLEVLKLLKEDNVIAKDEVWTLITDISNIDIPSKVYDVIKRRLDRLMKVQRGILDFASVIGDEFQSDVVGSVTGSDRIALLRNLGEIEKTHQLIHYLQEKYRFNHAKIREVLYNGITDELRKEYHRIVGDTIAELHRDDPGEVINELAHHYYEAGDERAGEYLLQAADKARDDYANEEAVGMYGKALDFIADEDKVQVHSGIGSIRMMIGDLDLAMGSFEEGLNLADGNEVRSEMLMKMGSVYERKGEWARSLETLDLAKELVDDRVSLPYSDILKGEGTVHWKKGDFEKAITMFLESLGTLEKLGYEGKEKAVALRLVGNIFQMRNDLAYSLEFYKKSLDVMEKVGDQRGIAGSSNNVGLAYIYTGDQDKALEYCARGLEIRLRIGDQEGLGMSYQNMGSIHRNKGELDKALEYHRLGLEIRQKIGIQYDIGWSLNNMAAVYLDRGDFDTAMEYYLRSQKIFLELGDKLGISTVLISIGFIQYIRGRTREAVEIFNEAIERGRKLGDGRTVGHGLINLGYIHFDNGELEKALEYYEKSLEIRQKDRLRGDTSENFRALAALYLGKKDPERALEYASKASGISSGLLLDDGMNHQTQGMVFRDMGKWSGSEAEFEKAQTIFREVGDRVNVAKTLYEQALLCKAKGEPEKARELLENAHKLYGAMGMKPSEEKCRKALGEL